MNDTFLRKEETLRKISYLQVEVAPRRYCGGTWWDHSQTNKERGTFCVNLLARKLKHFALGMAAKDEFPSLTALANPVKPSSRMHTRVAPSWATFGRQLL